MPNPIPNYSIGQELLNVPMGEMIRSMAMSIADAQWNLDKSSLTVAELMSGQRLLRDLDTGRLIDFDGHDIEGTGKIPRVIDSRVYFGYTYVPERDDKGAIVNKRLEELDDKGKPKLDADKNPIMRDVPQMVRVPNRVSMLELGFVPTFYQFVDTVIDVKITVRMAREIEETERTRESSYETEQKDLTVEEKQTQTWGWSNWWYAGQYTSTASKHRKVGTSYKALATSVDAGYSQRFSFSAEGSSNLKTKLVPIPPPAVLEERVRQVMEEERDYKQAVRAGLMVPADDAPKGSA